MAKPKIIQCLLCPKECKLYDGQRGDCRVRIHLDGKLQTLVYGRPCAVHIDPVEKKPVYHLLPGSQAFSIATAGCNLHCKFCQNWEISQKNPEETVNYFMPPKDVVNNALTSGSKSIAYTYSDPNIYYEYVLDTAKLAKKAGLKNIVISAGYINPEPLKELSEFLDVYKVDLKAFNNKFYQEICSATLQPVLETLKNLKKLEVWTEIVNLIIPTLNDDFTEIRKMCKWIKSELGNDVPIHFLQFYPQYKLNNLPPTPLETLTGARKIAIEEGLNYVYLGNIPQGEGNNTYCPNCKNLLIERIGYFVKEMRINNGLCNFCKFKIAGIWG
ncbi:MAG: AmmeMemoRadiSam system radical SAM enzyme [bacterium]|nr:AmmeMemoRadiSam system radical SAM enzyme [bacterium]